MGCTASKLDNEETVRRCKERRRLIKEAVLARHNLAAAHVQYCHSLRRTGKALSSFAYGEPLIMLPNTPPVIIHNAPSRATHHQSSPSSLRSSSFHAPPPPSRIQSRRQRSVRVPHILSETETDPYTYYARTPSQASSAWNWENFRPPSPPPSEYFPQNAPQKGHYYEETETEREEVLCSEWEDHYTTTTSSSYEDREIDQEIQEEDTDANPRFGSSNIQTERSRFGSEVEAEGGNSERGMVVKHRDLKEIVDAINVEFNREATAGEALSEMLETGRAQLDRSFTQLKKTLYHSTNVFSNLSSAWTSKPPLAVKYQLDASSLVEIGGPKSLCSTLERLLAWEKKLYQEVKAREGAKIGNEKKLCTLQSQEYKGDEESKLYKTKVSIKRLQSLIIVTSQAVSTTSNAITTLKDADLVPLLIGFCHQLMYMWTSMNEFHEIQSCIVQQVRGLMNQTAKSELTTELHREVTRELESAVSSWHSSFCKLIKYQREFIQSIHGWLKLALLPINGKSANPKDISPGGQSFEVFSFCDEWKLALDRVPDTVASEAIKSFVNVVHVISVKQTEELKMKRRAEMASRDLKKKASTIRRLEKKFYESYSLVGVGIPDKDVQDPLMDKKLDLAACRRRLEDEMARHAKAVEVTRSMTLNNIQTGLPGVFQAMSSFSALFVEAMKAVCTRSYAIKIDESHI